MNSHDLPLTLSAFLDCSEPAARALANVMEDREYEPRDYLHHQGDAQDRLWLVLEGIVQLRAVSQDGQSTVISAFGPGQLIGGHPDNEGAPYDAQAVDPVAALEIKVESLAECLDQWPELGAGLSRIYAGQLSSVLDRLAVRVSLSAMGRFYRELLRLAGSSDTISPPPVIASLALSAQTTRETGSRATSALERRGIIERSSGGLRIVSRRLLEELIV